MKTWALLLAAAALAPLLAGCSSHPPAPAPPSALGLSPEGLHEGAYYAFDHRGGELVFAVPSNGSADVILYDSHDRRVGHIGLGGEVATGRFVLDGIASGELVVQVIALNGTLDIRTHGSAVEDFRELPRHVERHLLVDRPSQAPVPVLPSAPPLNSNPLDETVNVTLLRAPAGLRVVAHASFQDLRIRAEGRQGVVHEVDYSGTTIPPFGFGTSDGVLPGKTYPENIRDGELTVNVQASSFEGTLVLEADSFSRAQQDDGGATPTLATPRFTYGQLPEDPVSFDVKEGTKSIYLWQEGVSATTDSCDATVRGNCSAGTEAIVALFGPHDERVATVRVPGNGTIALAVEASGPWVAVLLHGDATLGADAVPGDFELHPLKTKDTVVPSQESAQDNGYKQEREPLDAAGVPYHVEGVVQYANGQVPFDPTLGVLGQCSSSFVSLLQDGETLGAWGYAAFEEPTEDPDLLLARGALEVEHGDYGSGCDHFAVQVTGYLR